MLSRILFKPILNQSHVLKTRSLTCRNYSVSLKETNEKMAHILNVAAGGFMGSRNTLKQILKLTQNLRQTGQSLNSETYEHILSAYAKAGEFEKISFVHNQMISQGIKPERTFYDKALKFLAKIGDAVGQARLINQMEYFGYPITSKTYNSMFLCMRHGFELERALDTLETMEKKGIQPSVTIYSTVIDMALSIQQPELAYTLIEKAKELKEFDKKTDGLLYMNILTTAALVGNYNIVLKTWDTAIDNYHLTPDEGLCIYVLDVAGKNNDPKLAGKVIKLIGELDYPYRDVHFMPLVEAFASTGDMKSTFQVFSSMRKVGVIPNKKVALSVVHRLGKDKNAIRKAKEALEKTGEAGEDVDVSAFNLVIHALAYNREYDEAISLFGMAEKLKVKVNSETLDATLDICIHCKDAELGKSIYEELTEEGVKETNTTLSKMVTLICTQDDYDEAFFYLEKMKQLNMVPLRGCYYKLVKTLSKAGDPRLQMLLEDMEAYGYSISNYLNEFMENTEAKSLESNDNNPKPITRQHISIM